MRWQLAAAAHDILADPRQVNVDDQLAILLRAREPASVRRVVLHALKHGNTIVQRTALRALENEPLKDDLPALLEQLTAAGSGVRGHAARATGVHESPMIVELLAQRLEVERDEWVQKSIAIGLRRQQTDALFSALIPIIRRGPGLRRRLAIALVRERTGRAALWSQVLAHAADPTDSSRGQLLGADVADRRAGSPMPTTRWVSASSPVSALPDSPPGWSVPASLSTRAATTV